MTGEIYDEWNNLDFVWNGTADEHIQAARDVTPPSRDG